MAHLLLNVFHVLPVAQKQTCKGVPQIVETDVFDLCCCKGGIEFFLERVLWPEILIATRSRTPALTMFLTAVCRKSWNSRWPTLGHILLDARGGDVRDLVSLEKFIEAVHTPFCSVERFFLVDPVIPKKFFGIDGGFSNF